MITYVKNTEYVSMRVKKKYFSNIKDFGTVLYVGLQTFIKSEMNFVSQNHNVIHDRCALVNFGC